MVVSLLQLLRCLINLFELVQVLIMLVVRFCGFCDFTCVGDLLLGVAGLICIGYCCFLCCL